MRKVILTAISILAMVIIVSLNTASAEKRHIVIEMGEGGQTISFPMTAEEIAAIDAQNSKQRESKALNSQQNASRFKIIEMGESGQIVSFLMTPEEITAEDAEKRPLSEIHRKISADDRHTVAYETAESGILIEFPERVLEVNTVIIAKIENP
jgi:hypothetical protein